MTLDTATRKLVDLMASKATKPRHELTPAEARELLAGLRGLVGTGPQQLRAVEVQIPVKDADLPARIYFPEDEKNVLGLLVYFHGGGWVVGSIDVFERLCRELALATGCMVAAVDYRKAPEHPYPGPVEDAWAALNWVVARQAELTGRRDTDPALALLVGGDSAGANLAIACTFRASHEGAPGLAAQLLVYPVTDCGMDTPSYRDPENQLMLTRETMAWYWNHYAPGVARAEPQASPLRATDLSGLPPAVILTAEHDVLRDEGQAYAGRLQDAGVAVTHRCFAGQMHGFLMMGDLLPGSAEGFDFIGRSMRALLDSKHGDQEAKKP